MLFVLDCFRLRVCANAGAYSCTNLTALAQKLADVTLFFSSMVKTVHEHNVCRRRRCAIMSADVLTFEHV